VLRLNSLSVSYGRIRALDGVSIDVEQGETVAVLGPNGAGKTSLGRAVVGLIRHGGTVVLDDQSITKMRADQRCRSGISYVPSSGRVFPSLTVREHIEICARNFPEFWTLIGDRFPILVSKASQRAGTLSGGQQQLLSIARALASQPRYLVLDEPSAGLAPVIVEEVFDALRNLPNSSLGVLLLEQNASLGLDLADRCAVLSGGEMRLTGPAGEMAGSAAIEDLYLGIRAKPADAGESSGVSAGAAPAPMEEDE
jgi:branched-chain amino acid transport system ATP-binding protein